MSKKGIHITLEKQDFALISKNLDSALISKNRTEKLVGSKWNKEETIKYRNFGHFDCIQRLVTNRY